VPIGLIDTSIGGTTVETWTPQAAVESIQEPETQDKLNEWQEKIAAYNAQEDLQRRIDNYERKKKQLAEQGKSMPPNSKPPSDLRPGPIADRNRPGYCYAGVIKPLEGLAIKGAVFHQGFNNCFGGSAGARMYYQVFGKMITSWRQAFHDEQMPFCIISLCTAGEPQTMENFVKPMMDIGAMIREAQYQTFRDLRDAGDENIGFVSSFDLRKSWYHPQIKIPAGERAAKWALVTQYELLQDRDADLYWLPPSIEEVKVADGTIRLTMSDVIRTKDDSDGKMLGFAIAGEDRRFYPADIQYYTDGTVDSRNRPQYKRNMLVLSSPFLAEPVHYRYAWARNPMANLVNSRGVPLATQRSDDWLPEETPIKFLLPPGATLKTHGRWIRDRINRELGLADTHRQIQEAEATIVRLKEKHAQDKEAWETQKATERKRAEDAWKEAGQ
jgi:sialate O-acetylesterase